MKIALLSNVNIDPVNRLLVGADGIETYQSQGYGNELGALLDKGSPLHSFHPRTVFLFIDTAEIIGHRLETDAADKAVSEWFTVFESALQNDIVYYVSDAYLYARELEASPDRDLKRKIEDIWDASLRQLVAAKSQVRRLPYRRIIEEMGESHSFSEKMWYMGKIPHTTDCHRKLAEMITRLVAAEAKTAKKVLLLDLDNTLWGGLAGEHNLSPIVLSDDKTGLAYKNFQRVIKQMRSGGVLLGVVSKNNAGDALDIIRNHPHMVLKEDDFAVLKINWANKADNIAQIASELNLGTDSFVFLDDSPAERKLVADVLPDVTVPDFPSHPEELPRFMTDVYHRYFEKAAVTAEDMAKTEQYKANRERDNLRLQSADFNSYLKSLDMKLTRVDPQKHAERFMQLMNKTNQFNLTTRRFSVQEVNAVIAKDDAEVFLYRVTDRFGDNGIVVAAIVEYGGEAVITEFTMSCRVMGRRIENAVVEDMEQAARQRGYDRLVALYIPTPKNKPVENLYASLGYQSRAAKEDGASEFVIDLDRTAARDYCLCRLNMED